MAIRPQPQSGPAAKPAAPAASNPQPGNGANAPDLSDKLGAAGEPAGDLAAVAEQQGAAESPEQAGRNPVDEAIRQRAYEIWESEGRPEGRDREHWSRAAGEIGQAQPGA